LKFWGCFYVESVLVGWAGLCMATGDNHPPYAVLVLDLYTNF
jgi:hypothetical protein